MAPSSGTAFELVRDVVAVSRERGLGVKAAGLAYHSFNALVPLVILLLVGVTLVDGLEVILDALETATGLETAVSRDALEEATGDGAGRTRAAAIAAGILLWSGVRLFRAVDRAFTDLYGDDPDGGPVRAVATASLVTALYVGFFTTTVAVGVALVGLLGVSLSLLVGGPAGALAASALLLVALTAVFLPTYYVFPEADVTLGEVVPGTVFAALSWTVLAFGFRLYVSTSDSVALFGVAGAVLLILTWVYLGGLCLLVGAVLNAVLADRVQVDEDAVPAPERWPTP